MAEAEDCTALLSIDVGKKNLALCCLLPGPDPHARQDRILFWVVTSTLPACHALVETLRATGVLDLLPRIREVLIERQPGKNTPMVRLQCYLEMYFTMHDKQVTLADSKHKLSFAAASPYWPGGVPESWSYYTRKKLAVHTMANFLNEVEQPEGVKETFERSAKKDDLADSCLQAMAHAHFVAPLANARAEAKRARVPPPRRPSAQQLAAGKLAKSHVVALIVNSPGALDSEDALNRACDEYRPLRKAITRHFGSLEYCLKVLSTWHARREETSAAAKAAAKSLKQSDTSRLATP